MPVHQTIRVHGPWVFQKVLMPEVLSHLPDAVHSDLVSRVIVISADWCDAFHIPASMSRHRDIVVITDRFLREHPEPDVEFISTVLHELAHAYRRHGNKTDDGLTQQEKDGQEAEADDLARQWFPDFVQTDKKAE